MASAGDGKLVMDVVDQDCPVGYFKRRNRCFNDEYKFDLKSESSLVKIFLPTEASENLVETSAHYVRLVASARRRNSRVDVPVPNIGITVFLAEKRLDTVLLNPSDGTLFYSSFKEFSRFQLNTSNDGVAFFFIPVKDQLYVPKLVANASFHSEYDQHFIDADQGAFNQLRTCGSSLIQHLANSDISKAISVSENLVMVSRHVLAMDKDLRPQNSIFIDSSYLLEYLLHEENEMNHWNSVESKVIKSIGFSSGSKRISSGILIANINTDSGLLHLPLRSKRVTSIILSKYLEQENIELQDLIGNLSLELDWSRILQTQSRFADILHSQDYTDPNKYLLFLDFLDTNNFLKRSKLERLLSELEPEQSAVAVVEASKKCGPLALMLTDIIDSNFEQSSIHVEQETLVVETVLQELEQSHIPQLNDLIMDYRTSLIGSNNSLRKMINSLQGMLETISKQGSDERLIALIFKLIRLSLDLKVHVPSAHEIIVKFIARNEIETEFNPSLLNLITLTPSVIYSCGGLILSRK